MNLSVQPCLNHGQREAAARCPECGHFFCRECITEHEDRVICAACLKKTARTEKKQGRGAAVLARLVSVVFGVFTAWLAFYWVGRILLSIPADFHDGTLWKTTFWEE